MSTRKWWQKQNVVIINIDDDDASLFDQLHESVARQQANHFESPTMSELQPYDDELLVRVAMMRRIELRLLITFDIMMYLTRLTILENATENKKTEIHEYTNLRT